MLNLLQELLSKKNINIDGFKEDINFIEKRKGFDTLSFSAFFENKKIEIKTYYELNKTNKYTSEIFIDLNKNLVTGFYHQKGQRKEIITQDDASSFLSLLSKNGYFNINTDEISQNITPEIKSEYISNQEVLPTSRNETKFEKIEPEIISDAFYLKDFITENINKDLDLNISKTENPLQKNDFLYIFKNLKSTKDYFSIEHFLFKILSLIGFDKNAECLMINNGFEFFSLEANVKRTFISPDEKTVNLNKLLFPKSKNYKTLQDIFFLKNSNNYDLILCDISGENENNIYINGEKFLSSDCYSVKKSIEVLSENGYAGIIVQNNKNILKYLQGTSIFLSIKLDENKYFLLLKKTFNQIDDKLLEKMIVDKKEVFLNYDEKNSLLIIDKEVFSLSIKNLKKEKIIKITENLSLTLNKSDSFFYMKNEELVAPCFFYNYISGSNKEVDFIISSYLLTQNPFLTETKQDFPFFQLENNNFIDIENLYKDNFIKKNFELFFFEVPLRENESFSFSYTMDPEEIYNKKIGLLKDGDFKFINGESCFLFNNNWITEKKVNINIFETGKLILKSCQDFIKEKKSKDHISFFLKTIIEKIEIIYGINFNKIDVFDKMFKDFPFVYDVVETIKNKSIPIDLNEFVINIDYIGKEINKNIAEKYKDVNKDDMFFFNGSYYLKKTVFSGNLYNKIKELEKELIVNANDENIALQDLLKKEILKKKIPFPNIKFSMNSDFIPITIKKDFINKFVFGENIKTKIDTSTEIELFEEKNKTKLKIVFSEYRNKIITKEEENKIEILEKYLNKENYENTDKKISIEKESIENIISEVESTNKIYMQVESLFSKFIENNPQYVSLIETSFNSKYNKFKDSLEKKHQHKMYFPGFNENIYLKDYQSEETYGLIQDNFNKLISIAITKMFNDSVNKVLIIIPRNKMKFFENELKKSVDFKLIGDKLFIVENEIKNKKQLVGFKNCIKGLLITTKEVLFNFDNNKNIETKVINDFCNFILDGTSNASFEKDFFYNKKTKENLMKKYLKNNLKKEPLFSFEELGVKSLIINDRDCYNNLIGYENLSDSDIFNFTKEIKKNPIDLLVKINQLRNSSQNKSLNVYFSLIPERKTTVLESLSFSYYFLEKDEMPIKSIADFINNHIFFKKEFFFSYRTNFIEKYNLKHFENMDFWDGFYYTKEKNIINLNETFNINEKNITVPINIDDVTKLELLKIKDLVSYNKKNNISLLNTLKDILIDASFANDKLKFFESNRLKSLKNILENKFKEFEKYSQPMAQSIIINKTNFKNELGVIFIKKIKDFILKNVLYKDQKLETFEVEIISNDTPDLKINNILSKFHEGKIKVLIINKKNIIKYDSPFLINTILYDIPQVFDNQNTLSEKNEIKLSVYPYSYKHNLITTDSIEQLLYTLNKNKESLLESFIDFDNPLFLKNEIELSLSTDSVDKDLCLLKRDFFKEVFSLKNKNKNIESFNKKRDYLLQLYFKKDFNISKIDLYKMVLNNLIEMLDKVNSILDKIDRFSEIEISLNSIDDEDIVFNKEHPSESVGKLREFFFKKSSLEQNILIDLWGKLKNIEKEFNSEIYLLKNAFPISTVDFDYNLSFLIKNLKNISYNPNSIFDKKNILDKYLGYMFDYLEKASFRELFLNSGSKTFKSLINNLNDISNVLTNVTVEIKKTKVNKIQTEIEYIDVLIKDFYIELESSYSSKNIIFKKIEENLLKKDPFYFNEKKSFFIEKNDRVIVNKSKKIYQITDIISTQNNIEIITNENNNNNISGAFNIEKSFYMNINDYDKKYLSLNLLPESIINKITNNIILEESLEKLSYEHLLENPYFDFIMNKIKNKEDLSTLIDFSKIKNETVFFTPNVLLDIISNLPLDFSLISLNRNDILIKLLNSLKGEPLDIVLRKTFALLYTDPIIVQETIIKYKQEIFQQLLEVNKKDLIENFSDNEKFRVIDFIKVKQIFKENELEKITLFDIKSLKNNEKNYLSKIKINKEWLSEDVLSKYFFYNNFLFSDIKDLLTYIDYSKKIITEDYESLFLNKNYKEKKMLMKVFINIKYLELKYEYEKKNENSFMSKNLWVESNFSAKKINTYEMFFSYFFEKRKELLFKIFSIKNILKENDKNFAVTNYYKNEQALIEMDLENIDKKIYQKKEMFIKNQLFDNNNSKIEDFIIYSISSEALMLINKISYKESFGQISVDVLLKNNKLLKAKFLKIEEVIHNVLKIEELILKETNSEELYYNVFEKISIETQKNI